MAVTLLIPTSMADRCYLIEALMWVALHRFPLSSRAPGASWDNRGDEQNINGAAPSLPNDLTVTDDECIRAGLPQNPAYEALREGKAYEDAEEAADSLARDGLSESYEQYLREAAAFHQVKAAWDSIFEKFLAEPKARLLSALRRGEIIASGAKVAPRTLGRLLNLEDFRWPDLPPIPGLEDIGPSPGLPWWQIIKPDFWCSAQVHWDGCWAESTDTAYCLIVMELEDLLMFFPPPQPEKFAAVVKIAGTLALVDRAPTRRRGRPPFNWPEFHQEAVSYIQRNGLPPKQEAFISYMSDRCLTLWGKTRKRSSIATQLSRYYQK